MCSIVFIILFSTFAVGSVRPVGAVYIEYLGRETKDSWVPVFTLYDPPGDKSYSKFTKTTESEFTVSVGGEMGGNNLDGAWTFRGFFEQGWGTPNEDREHGVIAFKYRMTWDVYCYITTHSVYYKAVLRDQEKAQDLGIIVGFDSLNEKDLLVEDLTGTSGEYEEEVHTGEGFEADLTLGYKTTTMTYLCLGFEIELLGINFRGGVSIKTGNSTYTKAYYYWKSTQQDLDFNIYSDNVLGAGLVDSKGVWFSE